MCEAVILSHRSTKELFVPVLDKKTIFQIENHYFNENKADVVTFLAAQAKAS